jgi:cytochrome c biogenesis protein CcmG/thiol:disulfide interchange protein DsbE
VTATIPADAPATPPPDRPRRDVRTATWVAIALAVVLVAFVAVLATRDSAQDTLAKSPLLGKPAPEVIGPGLDSSTVRLSTYRGQYVVLNFFATWCGPCRAEHDDLLRFTERHAAQGDATVLAVIFDDAPKNVRTFLEQRGGDWPVLDDPRGKVSLDFGVRGLPESFLIDRDGVVRAKITGQVTDAGLDRLISELQRQDK